MTIKTQLIDIMSDGTVSVLIQYFVEDNGEEIELENRRTRTSLHPSETERAKEILPEHLYNTVATLWGSEPIKQEIIKEVERLTENKEAAESELNSVQTELLKTQDQLEQAQQKLETAHIAIREAKEAKSGIESEIAEKQSLLSNINEGLIQESEGLTEGIKVLPSQEKA